MTGPDRIVVWVGRFTTHDGYGIAARSLVRALRGAGLVVVPVDLASRRVVGPVSDGDVTVEQRGSQLTLAARHDRARIHTVVHDRPDRYPGVQVGGRAELIGFSYWEADEVPAGWGELLASMDRVWTSSAFNAQAFRRAAVPDWMIDLVPQPVDPAADAVRANRSEHRSRWKEGTVFLSFVSGDHGRRDIDALLEAYLLAFDPTDDVALVLKVPPGASSATRDSIERSLQLFGPDRSAPVVHIVDADLSREQILRLHASVDCYVSCERGNGWDLPAMDSVSLDIPVVAVGYGASTEFLEPDDAFIVEAGDPTGADDAIPNGHALYQGHTWAHVDPSDIARQLVAAYSDPRERSERGARAGARVRTRFTDDIAAHAMVRVLDAADDVRDSGNGPAIVTVSPDANLWAVRGGGRPSRYDVPTPRTLANAARSVKRSSEHLATRWRRTAVDEAAAETSAAHASGAATDETGAVLPPHPKRSRIWSGAVAAERRWGLAKVRSIPAKVDRLARIGEAVTDYEATVAGASTRFEPAEMIERRRAMEAFLGPTRTPTVDLDRLRSLRDRHLGERIFVLGNGPSLLRADLDRLAGEYTIGVNKIYLLGDHVSWQPTFYTLLDWKMGPAVADELHRIRGIKLLPERFRGLLEADDDTYWYWTRPVGRHVRDQFEPDITSGIPSRATVLVTAIQQAFYLGFRDIVLIGVDASYTIPDTVRQHGPDVFGSGVRLHLTSTADDDPNHFTPSYFGAGAEWHDPNVVDMHRMFRLMRKGVERHGGTLRNATDGGRLEVLERVGFDELFD